MSTTPTPEPLTPEQLAEIARNNSWVGNTSDRCGWEPRLFATIAERDRTIDKLQAEKAESDARLAAVLAECDALEEIIETGGTAGIAENVSRWMRNAATGKTVIPPPISGGKQNG